MIEVTIKAEYLFEFGNFNQWVRKASQWFKPYKFGYHYVCLDKENNVCHIGEDFMNARDKELFPVKVYALNRACQKPAKQPL